MPYSNAAMAGKTYTISAIIGDELITATGKVTATSEATTFVSGKGSNGNAVRLRYSSTNRMFFEAYTPNGGETVAYCKLEEGEGQTLAYQDEDGNWQLFETPDYAEELAKCQRYLWVSSASASGWSVLGHAIALNATTAYLLVDLPVTPRKVVPNIAADISTSLFIRNTSSISGVVTAMSVDSASRGSSKVLIVLTGTFTAGTTYFVYSGGNNPLILSWQL